MIRINLSVDPSSWGSSTTVEEAAELASILSDIVEVECGKESVPVTVTQSLFGTNSADDGFEDDLLWAEGMIGGPWMELALSRYEDILMANRVEARVAGGEHWFDAFNAEFAGE